MYTDWDNQVEVEKHRWADFIILQIPVNWMGVPWKFKKYTDEVLMACAVAGVMFKNDGRSKTDPKL